MSTLVGVEGGAEAWLRATDRVLSGLNHALANGLFPLRAIASLVPPGSPFDAESHEAVGLQVARLEELLRLYRLMRFPALEAPEPSRVADVISDALALLRHHADGFDAQCTVDADPGAPPVLVHPTALTQAVLLLLAGVARCANPAAAGRKILLRYFRRGDWVELAAETVGVAIGSPGGCDELTAIRTVLGDAAGTIGETSLPGGATGVTVQIASLAAMRARERTERP